MENIKDIKVQKINEKDIEARKLIAQIQSGNAEAEAQLVELYKGYTAAIVRKFKEKATSLTDEEMVSASEYGLKRAAQKFDLNREFTFISYAKWWMIQVILQEQKAKKEC